MQRDADARHGSKETKMLRRSLETALALALLVATPTLARAGTISVQYQVSGTYRTPVPPSPAISVPAQGTFTLTATGTRVSPSGLLSFSGLQLATLSLVTTGTGGNKLFGITGPIVLPFGAVGTLFVNAAGTAVTGTWGIGASWTGTGVGNFTSGAPLPAGPLRSNGNLVALTGSAAACVWNGAPLDCLLTPVSLKTGATAAFGVSGQEIARTVSFPAVPSPGSLGLVLTGLLGVAAGRRWRRRSP